MIIPSGNESNNFIYNSEYKVCQSPFTLRFLSLFLINTPLLELIISLAPDAQSNAMHGILK